MRFPVLEFLERGEIRVRIIERDDETERDLIVLLMIDEAPAPGVAERPTLRVNDPARLMFLGRNIP